MKDPQIIEHIRAGKDHTAFKILYGHLSAVERHVRKNNGSRADAKDIFQDALVILHRKSHTTWKYYLRTRNNSTLLNGRVVVFHCSDRRLDQLCNGGQC